MKQRDFTVQLDDGQEHTFEGHLVADDLAIEQAGRRWVLWNFKTHERVGRWVTLRDALTHVLEIRPELREKSP